MVVTFRKGSTIVDHDVDVDPMMNADPESSMMAALAKAKQDGIEIDGHIHPVTNTTYMVIGGISGSYQKRKI